MNYRVLKFGGTSMGSAHMIETSSDIVISQCSADIQIWCVVSAMSGVTNTLYEIIENIKIGNKNIVTESLTEFYNKHFSTLAEIVGEPQATEVWNNFFHIPFTELTTIAEGLTLLRDVSDKYIARIVYFGEVFSSLLMTECLKKKNIKTDRALSRTLIAAEGQFTNGTLDMPKTREISKKAIDQYVGKSVVVVTGFAGGDTQGNTILFDRGGSDYVATILGASIAADRIEIWTDVDGVYSADPRRVSKPILWKEINYDVAAELALSGAKVLHPKTISPAQADNIPVYIKNTFAPEKTGTKIDNINQDGPVGMNITTRQTLFHFSDPTMCGAVGFIYHVLEVFYKAQISIDALTTSEISFTCSLGSQDVTQGLIDQCSSLGNLKVFSNLAKISILGKGFSNLSIVSEKIHKHLTDYTVYMISQNASFTNITIFVDEKDANKILEELHSSIFDSSISLG